MTYENPWRYDNGNEEKIIDVDDTIDFLGFVYLITNMKTKQKYIGKKLFTSAKSKKLKGKKRKTRYRVQSDWQQYYGSSADLIADVEKYGVDNFKRRVLRLCKTKGECSYFEAKYIFDWDALLDPLYYNKWLSVRVRSEHFKHLMKE